MYSSAKVKPKTGSDPDIRGAPGLRQIKAAEKRFKYVRLLSTKEEAEPKNVENIRAMIKEMNAFSALLRKYMPRNAMNNANWRAADKYINDKYPERDEGIDNYNSEIEKHPGNPCYVKDRPMYVARIVDLLFAFVIEGGQMKLLTLVKVVD